jgi:hypothetical protein
MRCILEASSQPWVVVCRSYKNCEADDGADNCVAGAPEDVKEKYGDMTDEEYFKDLFKDGPTLCGQTCAYLATGRGKELRGLFLGRYLSSRTQLLAMLTSSRLSARCQETS